MQLDKPRYMLYAQTGPASGDYFTTQAWSDEELDNLIAQAPSTWDVTVYVMRVAS